MKKIYIMVVAVLHSCITYPKTCKQPACKIYIIPEWNYLSFGDKKFTTPWIHTTSIIIKKRFKTPIVLDEITLQWHGPFITTLSGSLFSQYPNQELEPTEKNFISDGDWFVKPQILQLKFEKNQYLDPTTILCVVITTSKDKEALLKKGYFTLITNRLPKKLQQILLDS